MKEVKVTKYQTSDGDLFDTASSAAEHEAKLSIKALLNDGEEGNMKLFGFVWEYLREIHDIQETLLSSIAKGTKKKSSRPRRPKAEAAPQTPQAAPQTPVQQG